MRRILVALGGVVAVIALLCSCGTAAIAPVQPPTITVPVFHTSCTQVSSTATVIPIKVLSSRDIAEIYAGVCVDGQGPFTFQIDTGASISSIDQKLAAGLTFTQHSPSFTETSFACQVSQHLAVPQSLSIGGRRLTPTTMLVGPFASVEEPGLRGLIGSDVLSSFGAVRFDFVHDTLTLQAKQHTLTRDVAGSSRRPTAPAALTRGTNHTVAMTVQVQSPGKVPGLSATVRYVQPRVPVLVGTSDHAFVLDTGASATVVSSSVATSAGLQPVGPSESVYAGLDCRVTARYYTLSHWDVGNVALASQYVGSNVLPSDTPGLFGAGTLQYFSTVVVDFTDGELIVGPFTGPQPRPAGYPSGW